MNPGFPDDLPHEPETDARSPELLISSLLHLISHYSVAQNEQRACLKLAVIIERHFQALADLKELAPVLRATCQQLNEQWSHMVEKALCRQQGQKKPADGKGRYVRRFMHQIASRIADSTLPLAQNRPTKT